MRESEYESILNDALDTLACRWGPVAWRPLLQGLAPAPDPVLGGLFATLADVEEVSFYMQVLIRRIGVIRLAPVKEFNAIWLAEESEHARAMAELARTYGTLRAARRTYPAPYRMLHSIALTPRIAAAGLVPRSLLGAYLATGSLQEYAALTTYRILAEAVDEPAVRELLYRVARQEGRHMRFYRTGAIAVLSDSPMAQRVVRHVLRTSWRPPGVDLLGVESWSRVFAPVLEQPGAKERYMRIDELAAQLPGLAGLRIGERFFGCGHGTVVSLPADTGQGAVVRRHRAQPAVTR
jgi:hypothetical protein